MKSRSHVHFMRTWREEGREAFIHFQSHRISYIDREGRGREEATHREGGRKETNPLVVRRKKGEKERTLSLSPIITRKREI